MREQSSSVAAPLKDIAASAKPDWPMLSEEMRAQGQLHLETH
jgi:hypothetical protein